MSREDLNLSEMRKMQDELYELNKEKWNDMNPNAAKNHLLYMVEEMGECISIIKKKGIDSIMQQGHTRERFVEEISDVLMYYTEVLRRLDITPKELSKAYVNKHENNLNRNYIEDNKKKYV